MTDLGIVDVEQLVLEGTRRSFEAWFKKKSEAYKWVNLKPTVDWSSFKVHHATPVFPEVKSHAPRSQVLFRSTFTNESDREQEHRLCTERRTVATCRIAVDEGFRFGLGEKVNLSNGLPDVLMDASAGFSKEMLSCADKDTCLERELKWTVESVVKVAPRSEVVAELVITEEDREGEFIARSYFLGSIRVTLFDKAGQDLIWESTYNDLSDFLTKERGFLRDEKGIYKETKGLCRFRFGVDQKIVTKSRPLKTP